MEGEVVAVDLNTVDASLGLLGELAAIGRGTSGHLSRMRQDAIFTDGAIPAKLKALAAALWGISARCEPCLRFYILSAKELGATEAEIGEILAVASTMGGCVGEMWALKALQAARQGVEGAKPGVESDASCCS